MAEQVVLSGMESIAPRGTQEPTPMVLLQMAMSQNADIEKLTKLMDLHERWEKSEARKAFDHAFAAFKAESVQITKNITVTDGPLKGKKYADLFAVVSATTAALSKHGLSSFWKLTKDEPEWMEVTCILRHELGHSETASMGGKPDVGGARSPIQARASTKSYLERYTFLAVTGQTASGEDNDGAMLNGELMEQVEWIENAKDPEELQRLYLNAYKIASASKNQGAMAAVIAAKNKRNKQFKSEAAQ
jgi:hypothetical protein